MTKPHKNAIVVVIDGLQAGMLGCYGNTWIKTPEIDRLASESFVFDQAIVDTPSLESLYGAYWSGKHALALRDANPIHEFKSPGCLPAILQSAGVACSFHTQNATADSSKSLACLGAACSFSDRPSEWGEVLKLATEVKWTQIASLFTHAMWSIADSRSPFLFQLHCRGMRSPWDAPYEFRKQYADEEDPNPPDFFDIPNLILPKNYDPDELLGIQQAYAGQISLIDTVLGSLVETLRDSPLAENTLLVVMGASGFPLGEHRVVGDAVSEPYSELIHVPWLIRSPDGCGKSARTSALIQPHDLFHTLLEWFDIPVKNPSADGKSLWPLIRGEVLSIRDRAGTFVNPQEWSLRTEKWHLRASGGDELKSEAPKLELYVKPDDRFEVNDVSSRCPEVVAALEEAWRDLVAAAESGRWDELPSLPEAATHGVD